MEKLLEKNTLTVEEATKLDAYFEEHVEELLVYKTAEIIRIVKMIEESLSYSLTKNVLNMFISEETFGLEYYFNEEFIDLYIKYFELNEYFAFNDCGVGYALADYFYNDNKKGLALDFYQRTFKEGYDLTNIGYYYSLERYLKMLNNNPSELLIRLIDSSAESKNYSLDYVNTCLLLIINLGENDDRYLKYIEKAIKAAKIVVSNESLCGTGLSDTDEERNLCELYSLKFEYLVHKKAYQMAYAVYKELTSAIHDSGCMRYYHARDLFYQQMIYLMSEEYPELTFFNDISFYRFKVVTKVDDINNFINKEIVLEKETKERFTFIVRSIYNNDDIVIVPILPLLGIGAELFTSLIVENDILYLENKFR